MVFQENLRKYRDGLGITAKDFAAKIGINYTTYANYENRGKEPKFDTLCKIADALHVSIDDLLGYQVDKWDYLLKRLGDNFQCIESSSPGQVTLLYWFPGDKEAGKVPADKTECTKEKLAETLESIYKRADKITEPTTKGIIEENILLRLFGGIPVRITAEPPIFSELDRKRIESGQIKSKKDDIIIS